jgi:PAT family beta-lactamase induction signal transducer AmpG
MVYWITAAFMLVGVVTSFVIREAGDDALAPQSMREAVIDPFREFFARDGIKAGLAILAFMFLYKLGDNMATALATPFYLDMGFSRTEIGSIAKVAALWSAIAGSIIGGAAMLKLSINKSLWIFGFVQMFTILGFAWLSVIGHNPVALFIVVSAEYLGVGLGTVALTAYIARETSRAFTATQFALFTSLIAVPRTFANASTGFLIEGMGYTSFFLLCTALAVPGMLMLFKAAPWSK